MLYPVMAAPPLEVGAARDRLTDPLPRLVGLPGAPGVSRAAGARGRDVSIETTEDCAIADGEIGTPSSCVVRLLSWGRGRDIAHRP